MKKNSILFLLVMFFVHITVLYGQPISALERGDKVPDLPIGNVTNYKNDILRISDFKGQWVLIDFWGDGCLGCVGGFPMLDSMQRKYEGKLSILLVSKNTEERLTQFVQSIRRKVTLPNIPHITADTVLSQFFPYIAVPYHVWIDPEGRFYAGTSSANFTPQNIDRLLSGEKPYFSPQVYRSYAEYTGTSLIKAATDIQPAGRSLYSFFTGYVPKGSDLGYESTYIDSVNQTIRKTFSNLSAASFAHNAFRKRNVERARIYYENIDAEELMEPDEDDKKEAWKQRHCYSYEVQIPLDASRSLTEQIQVDILNYLQSYAGITVREERRKIKVVKLVLTDGGESIRGNENRLAYRLFPTIQNADFDIFFWRPISSYYAKKNIYFEKDFDRLNFLVDITVGDNWKDLDSLRAILKPQGIELIEQEIEDQVLVLSYPRKES